LVSIADPVGALKNTALQQYLMAIPERIRGIKRRPMGQSKESYILSRRY
jgi:hypothetical protein